MTAYRPEPSPLLHPCETGAVHIWTPAFEAVIQSPNRAPSGSFPSFPRKRQLRDFSRLLLGARMRGDDEFVHRVKALTTAFAGVTKRAAAEGVARPGPVALRSARGAGAEHPQPAQKICRLDQLLVARRTDVLGCNRTRPVRGRCPGRPRGHIPRR